MVPTESLSPVAVSSLVEAGWGLGVLSDACIGMLATGWFPEKWRLAAIMLEKVNEDVAGEEEMIVALEFIVCGFKGKEISVAEEQNSITSEEEKNYFYEEELKIILKGVFYLRGKIAETGQAYD